MDLGFIDKSGNVITCEYGEHEFLAQKICRENGWESEKSGPESPRWHALYSDFLVYEKGYVMVNRPAGYETIIYAKCPTAYQIEKMNLYVNAGYKVQYIGDISIFE